MSLDVKFTDMSETQRGKWLAWAKSHDWASVEPIEFIEHETQGFTLKTACEIFDPQGISIERMFSKTPREMRDWAGY